MVVHDSGCFVLTGFALKLPCFALHCWLVVIVVILFVLHCYSSPILFSTSLNVVKVPQEALSRSASSCQAQSAHPMLPKVPVARHTPLNCDDMLCSILSLLGLWVFCKVESCALFSTVWLSCAWNAVTSH